MLYVAVLCQLCCLIGHCCCAPTRWGPTLLPQGSTREPLDADATAARPIAILCTRLVLHSASLVLLVPTVWCPQHEGWAACFFSNASEQLTRFRVTVYVLYIPREQIIYPLSEDFSTHSRHVTTSNRFFFFSVGRWQVPSLWPDQRRGVVPP